MEKTTKTSKFLKSKIFTLILLLAAIVVFFAIATKGSFLKPLNIRNILNSMVLVSLLAIGEGMLIIAGNIDLSAGAVGTLAGVLLSFLLTTLGLPWPVAVIGCLVSGAVCGLINAFLINELAFQPFIATLAMSSVAEGLTYVICGALAIPVKDKVITYVGTGRIFGQIPVSIIISLLALIIYGLILAKTKFGRTIYLCGGNRNAARLAGLNPKKLSYILFMNGGALAALAGGLLAARLKSGTPAGIKTMQFSGITAAILGGISFGGGSGGMLGCFIGLLIINGFNNGLTVMGIDPYWQTVASGLLLIIALLFDFFSIRSAARAHGGTH